MNNKIIDNQFTSEYAALPEEAKLYYSANVSGQAIIDIAAKYKVENKKIYALIFLLVNSGFDLKVVKDRVKEMNLTGLSAKNLWIEFLGLLAYPVEEFLENNLIDSGEITKELNRLGANVNILSKQKDKLTELIEDENLKVVEEMIIDFEKTVDPKEENIYVLDLLKNNLLDILRTESLNANLALNRGFIYLLYNVNNFKEDAITIIRNSQALIGHENIKIDDREVAPNVSNWLKAFIKSKGSDMFNDITLAQYLDRSDNVRKLNSEKKELLSSLLIFYKNINFFPRSMSNVLPINWQIFPFKAEDNDSLKLKKIDDILVEKKSEENIKSTLKDEEDKSKLISEIKQEFVDKTKKIETNEVKNGTVNEIKKIIVSEEKEDNLDRENILKLKEALKNYKPLSLEYKAISSEIKLLETNSEK